MGSGSLLARGGRVKRIAFIFLAPSFHACGHSLGIEGNRNVSIFSEVSPFSRMSSAITLRAVPAVAKIVSDSERRMGVTKWRRHILLTGDARETTLSLKT